MNKKLLKLSFVLQNIQSYPWDHDLYIHDKYPWSSDSECLILNSDEDVPESKESSLEYARQNSLNRTLSIQVIQDVVSNARQQKNNASGSDLLDAFNFYYKNDAFVELK